MMKGIMALDGAGALGPEEDAPPSGEARRSALVSGVCHATFATSYFSDV
jgi:hypothetical protein